MLTMQKKCNFEVNKAHLIRGMKMLHQLHSVRVPESANVRIFDIVTEAKKLIEIASATKEHLMRKFKTIIDKIDLLYPAIKVDAKRLGYELVLCHNVVYEPNYLYNDKKEMYLIDCGYANMNYVANDIYCILCIYD